MCIPRVSSVPTGLVVADFFVHASVPSAELCWWRTLLQNQRWPTCGQSGYVTPAVSGIPTAAERGAKSEVAHLWAQWLGHPCHLGDPHRFRAGGKIRSGPLVGKVATSPLPSRGSPPLQSGGGGGSKVAHLWAKRLRHPCRLGDPHRFRAGRKIRSGPLVGKLAMSPLPSRGSPPLQSGGQNQKWPTCGQSGYVTPAASGIPTSAERGGGGGESKVAHLWAKRLRHPCRLGDPHRFRAGGKIRSGPLVGKVATSPLPSRGSPPLQSGGQNQKWPTCGQTGDVTPAVSGIPTTSERGGKIRSGPLVGKVATSPLPSRGSPPLQSGGGNQKWPTCGQSGYVTPAVSGIPTAAERAGGGGSKVAHLWANWRCHPCRLGDPHRFRAGGGKSEVAHLWAKWLCHPCRLGDPHRFRAGGKIRSGPLVGKVATSPLASRGSPPLQSGGGGGIKSGPLVGKEATSPLPSRGSPPLQSGGGNQKWPTCGQSGFVTPGVSGIPTASELGAKSEVAHLWANWRCHPCRLGDPHHFRAGGNIRIGPLVGKVATSPLPSPGFPPLQSGGGGSEVAHLWAKRLRHPCRLGDPHCFRAGGKIRSGPLVGKLAMSPLQSRGSPPLQSGGQNQKWPTCGQSGYVTPAVSGIPTAAERGGGESEVAHLWAKWLRHPCRLGDPHRFTAGRKIRSGPLVGKVATSPLPSRGSPPLQSGGGGGGESKVAHLWAKRLRHPCRLGDPHRCRAGGGESEVAHLWAKWLRHPCRLGDPHRFTAGRKIRSGPLVGKVATSPLASRGSPPLQSGGGGSQK